MARRGLHDLGWLPISLEWGSQRRWWIEQSKNTVCPFCDSVPAPKYQAFCFQQLLIDLYLSGEGCTEAILDTLLTYSVSGLELADGLFMGVPLESCVSIIITEPTSDFSVWHLFNGISVLKWQVLERSSPVLDDSSSKNVSSQSEGDIVGGDMSSTDSFGDEVHPFSGTRSCDGFQQKLKLQ